jgi:hypothetical protein
MINNNTIPVLHRKSITINPKLQGKSFGVVGQVGTADRFHVREERAAWMDANEKKHKNKNGPDGSMGPGGPNTARKAPGQDDSHKRVWR